MSDSTLRIGIDGRPSQTGKDEVVGALKAIEAQAKRTADLIEQKFGGDGELGKGVDSVKGKFAALKDQIFSLQGAVAGLGFGMLIAKIVETNVEFQRLEANLRTVTGGVMQARAAFGELQKFAASTPFSLRSLTDAFTTLKLAGVDTSARSLTAYGNIAASFGRDITDLAIAVKSAMAGEMEALSAFGPKVTVQGDKMRIAFQGNVTEMERDGKKLEEFLIKLGETKFAGGMANQVATIAGAFSNFMDNLDRLMAAIGAGGLNDALRETFDWLNKVTSGGDQTAKMIGEVMGNAVRLLTAMLKFLVENWQLFLAAGKAFVAAKITLSMIQLGEAAIAAARSFTVLTAAMAKNPLTILAVLASMAAASLIDFTSALGLVEEEVVRLGGETKKMVGEFQKADDGSLDAVLANAKAIGDAFADAKQQIIESGDATGELARRMLILKALEQDSLEKALEFISQMSEARIIEIDTQQMFGTGGEDALTLEQQLKIAEAERDRARADLMKFNTGAEITKETLAKGRTVIDVDAATAAQLEQAGMSVPSHVEKAELDPDEVKKYGAEFVVAYDKAGQAIKKVDELQKKIDAQGKKQLDKEAKAEDKAITKMFGDIAALEMEAKRVAEDTNDLSLFGAESVEAEKAIAFRKEYDKITKDGTLPLAEEHAARIKKATDFLVEQKHVQDGLKTAAKEEKKQLEDLASIYRRMAILSDSSITDKQRAIQLGEYEAKLRAAGVPNVEELVDLERRRLEALQKVGEIEAWTKTVADLDGRIKQKREELRLLKLSGEARFIEAELIKAQQKALEAGGELLPEQIAEIVRKAKELYAVTQQVEEEEKRQKKVTEHLEKQKKLAEDKHGALVKFLSDNSWDQFITNLEDRGVALIEGLADAFAEFIVTGEMDWKGFFNTMSKDIIALILKLIIAKGIAMAIDAVVPGAGTAAQSGITTALVRHTGGLTSELSSTRVVPSSTFIGAQRYASGGIPGTRPGEIPAILHRGEAVVPLPNGRSIPVDLSGANIGGSGETHYHNWNLPSVSNPNEFRKTTRQLENEFNARMKMLKRRR
jgi:hypothetical protein